MNDSAMVLFIAEILGSCLIVVLGLFWLLRRRNEQFRQIERSMAVQSRALTEVFLERELRATQLFAKTATGDELSGVLVRLRSFWLEAEQQALIEHGTQPSDFDRIATALKGSRIYAQLKTSAKPASLTPVKPLPRADNSRLDRARELLDQHDIASTDNQALAPAATAATQEIAITATANSADLWRTIHRLEQELRRMNALYEQTSTHLDGLRDTDPPRNVTIVSSSHSPADLAQKSQVLLEEMRETYQYGLREIQRLRDTNTRQRELIMQMEQRLVEVAPDTAIAGETHQLIEKLQLQLRDYDNCTVILEGESDSLRERIDTLTQIIAVESKTPTPALREMAPEVAQKYVQARRVLDKKGFDMVQKVASASDLESAAVELIGFLQSQRLRATIHVHTHRKQLWLSSEGAVDGRIKTLLQSLQPKPENPRLDDGDNMILLLPICRLHIAGENLLGEEGKLYKNWLTRTVIIVDLMFKLLENSLGNSEKNSLESSQIDDVSHLLSSIETQHQYLESENHRITVSHRQEIEKVLAALPTTPSQKIVIEGVLGDFIAEADLVARAAKSMQKSLQLAQQAIRNLKS